MKHWICALLMVGAVGHAVKVVGQKIGHEVTHEGAKVLHVLHLK